MVCTTRVHSKNFSGRITLIVAYIQSTPICLLFFLLLTHSHTLSLPPVLPPSNPLTVLEQREASSWQVINRAGLFSEQLLKSYGASCGRPKQLSLSYLEDFDPHSSRNEGSGILESVSMEVAAVQKSPIK